MENDNNIYVSTARARMCVCVCVCGESYKLIVCIRNKTPSKLSIDTDLEGRVRIMCTNRNDGKSNLYGVYSV